MSLEYVFTYELCLNFIIIYFYIQYIYFKTCNIYCINITYDTFSDFY